MVELDFLVLAEKLGMGALAFYIFYCFNSSILEFKEAIAQNTAMLQSLRDLVRLRLPGPVTV